MIENNQVLECTSLFFDLDQVVPQLKELTSERSDLLMVVLCQAAMPVASQIARGLGSTLIFSPADLNAASTGTSEEGVHVDFDFDMVKESGRDIPQDFIVHQEQNLKTNLLSMYATTYQDLCKTYPDRLVILVDRLTNVDAVFFPCLTAKTTYTSGEKLNRQFIFLHISSEKAGTPVLPVLDIITEDTISGAE